MDIRAATESWPVLSKHAMLTLALLYAESKRMHMNDTKTCEWLMRSADAPIRYRVAREFLQDEGAAKEIETELFENPVVKMWLKNLKPEAPPQHWSMEHGSFDYCLENALLKAVQLGLHAGMLPIIDAVQYYIDKISLPISGLIRSNSGFQFQMVTAF